VKPAYFTIAAVILAMGSAVLAIADVVSDADAVMVLGVSIVLAIIGLRE
jgi:hypothetical protein